MTFFDELSDFGDSFMRSFSNVTRMRVLQNELKSQERMKEYRSALKKSVMQGDLKAGYDLAMGAGDAQTAGMFRTAHELKVAREFDRLARTDPQAAQQSDPTRWAQWKAGEDKHAATMAMSRAQLAQTQQSTEASRVQTLIAQENQAWRRGQVLTARERDRIARGAGEVLSIWRGGPENWQANLPAVNRYLKQNTGIFQKLFSLPKDRIPDSIVATNQGPNGDPVMSVLIRNERTGTTGPMTVQGGKGKGESVITDDPRRLIQRLRYYAGIKPSEPKVGRYKTEEIGGTKGVLDTATGEYVPMAKAQKQPGKPFSIGGGRVAVFDKNGTAVVLEKPREDQMADLNKHLDSMFKNPPMMATIDTKRETRKEAVRAAGNAVLGLGYSVADAKTVMARVLRELRSDSDPAKKLVAAKTVQDQNLALFEIMRQVGVNIPTVKAGASPAEIQKFVKDQRAKMPVDKDFRAKNWGRGVPPDDGSDFD